MHKFLIIHKDLKPDNIIITQNNSEVKIMDFTYQNCLGFGTLYYAAPEIIQNIPYNK